MIPVPPSPPTQDSEAPHILPFAQRRAASRAALRYSLILILLPLLAIPAGILLGQSDFFLHHGASLWVRSNDAVFDLHGRVCDVLVFGDSTAMTGIDPIQVEQHTGLRTCNIAVTNAVLAVTGTLTLDHFLAHNPKPGVLLVQLSPDGFQAESKSWHQTIYAEGMLEQLRHGTPSESRRLLLRHPVEATAFAGYATGYTAFYALRRIWFHTTHMLPQEDAIQVRAGSTFFTPPSPARSFCSPTLAAPPPAGQSYSRELVAAYRQGYASRAGTILVDVAPIPACDQYLEAYSAELQGVTSNRLQPLPIGLFNDGRHYTATGAEVVSELISQEIHDVASIPLPHADPLPHSPGLVASLRRARYPAHRSSHTPGRRSASQVLGLHLYPREIVQPAPNRPLHGSSALPADLYDDPVLPGPNGILALNLPGR